MPPELKALITQHQAEVNALLENSSEIDELLIEASQTVAECKELMKKIEKDVKTVDSMLDAFPSE